MTRTSRPKKHAYLPVEGGRAPNSGRHNPLGLSPILIHWRMRERLTVKLEGRLPCCHYPGGRCYIHLGLDRWLLDDNTRQWSGGSEWAHLSSWLRFVLPCVAFSWCGWLEKEEGEFDLGLGVVAVARLVRHRAQNDWLSLIFLSPCRDPGRIRFPKSWLIQRSLPQLLE